MGIRMIHGFLKEKQKANPEWGSISIVETVLVEMDSVEDNTIDVLLALPAAPNTVTSWNPKGISFTFDVSVHPETNVFILRKAGDVVQSSEGGGFWEIQLTYAVFSLWELTGPAVVGGSNTNPTRRKDQREFKDPMDRPVVWNRTTSLVQKERYTHLGTGDPIIHTNGLPITTPIKWSSVHSTHNFSYNVDFTDFDDSFYEPYLGKVNSDIALGKAAGKLKLVNYSANEEYESIGEGVSKTEYHYVRVSLSFEYNPDSWITDAKIVSMSTLQLRTMLVFPFTTYYDKIKVNATQYAEEPWPLDENGAAIPYDNNDPTNYGYLDTGLPVQIAFAPVVVGLTIP